MPNVRITTRYMIVVFLFLALSILYGQRTVLTVAILSMVNHTAVVENQNETTSEECPEIGTQNYTSYYKEGPYVWTQPIQGIILGSYFYGSVFAQFTGGTILFLFGPKKLLISSCIVSSIFVTLTPLASKFQIVVISLLQTIIGLAQGLALTAAFTILGRWSPENEKSTLTSVVHSGVQVGIIVGMSATGYLCEYGFLGGWPSGFYVFGAVGLIYSVLLLILVYERPNEHPRLSESELKFLKENVPNIDISSSDSELKVPWKEILTSRAVWVVAFTKICWGYGYYTLLSKLPAYLNIILHFRIEQNGLINALFYSGDALTIFLSGYIADFVIKRKYFSLTTTRKIFEAIGMFGPGLCILSVPLWGCDSIKVIIFLYLGMIFFGFTSSGDTAIVLDLAPEFAGILFGLTYGCSSAAGIISPYVAGLILDRDQADMVLWNYVFYIAAGCYLLGGIVFQIGATAELQSWAIKKPSSEKKEVTKF